jgi:hypothetical protein
VPVHESLSATPVLPVQAALGIMAGVLKPLGTALTRLPMGPGNPGRTAGAAFQMYYQMGNGSGLVREVGAAHRAASAEGIGRAVQRGRVAALQVAPLAVPLFLVGRSRTTEVHGS